jgi:hypothetical protein
MKTMEMAVWWVPAVCRQWQSIYRACVVERRRVPELNLHVFAHLQTETDLVWSGRGGW